MTPTISYNPENSKKLRELTSALSECKKKAQAEIQVATQEGDLERAGDVLKQASLRLKEYENFRKSLSKEELLLAKYGVEVINEHTILFVIPKGTSRISILEEANKLVQEREGRDLIRPSDLSEWQGHPLFVKEQEASKRLCINGHVKGGDGRTTESQQAFLKGRGTLMKKAGALLGAGLKEPFVMPQVEDLAVAFALNWIAKGQPLFGWFDKHYEQSYLIRAVGAPLYFMQSGLEANIVSGNSDNKLVGVSALVSPE